MFNVITSLFLILTAGSIPGQLLLIFVVIFFKKTSLQYLDAGMKKLILLSGFLLTITPLFYLAISRLISLFFFGDHLSGQLTGFFSYYDLSNTIFRNEWLMPLAFIWFAGVLFHLFRSRRRLFEFRDKILLEGTKCSIQDLAINPSELPVWVVNYLTKLIIVKHPQAQSPLVFGYRKLFLIIPDQPLTQNELHMVLSHEMTHLRNRDLWLKLIVEFIRLLFFYNPIFKHAAELLDDNCEKLCDRAVTADMPANKRKEYGHLLLNLSEQAEPAQKMTQAALSKDKEQLQSRLQAIVQPRVMPLIKRGFASALVVSIILAAFWAILLIMPQANAWDYSRQQWFIGVPDRNALATTFIYESDWRSDFTSAPNPDLIFEDGSIETSYHDIPAT